MPRSTSVFLFSVAILSPLSHAQASSLLNAQSQAITADSLVDQLVENAAVYRATLPSLTARETIVSIDAGSWLKLEGAHRAEAEAIMRVTRKTPDGPLEELR